jgi:hypothetical protein
MLFVKISFPQETIEQSGESVEGWFNRDLVPVEAVVKNIFLGKV